jgi:hypothetical protein
MSEHNDLSAPTLRTTVRRNAKRGVYDRAVIDAILDEGLVCHVAFVYEGKPCLIPTAYAREERWLYLHGTRKLQGDGFRSAEVFPAEGDERWRVNFSPTLVCKNYCQGSRFNPAGEQVVAS